MAQPDDTDTSLILAAQHGDETALEALASRWWPRLRRWALVELGDPSLAEDASQDALIRMMRHLHSCDASRPFGSWLRRLVRNVCHDLRTKRGLVIPFDHDRPQAPTVERSHDLVRGAQRAREAFCALSPRQRQVLELCDHQGQSADEVAEELEIAPGTVRALLHQGRSALRRRLVAHRVELVALLREAR